LTSKGIFVAWVNVKARLETRHKGRMNDMAGDDQLDSERQWWW
jgi:hypothetical protein